MLTHRNKLGGTITAIVFVLGFLLAARLSGDLWPSVDAVSLWPVALAALLGGVSANLLTSGTLRKFLALAVGGLYGVVVVYAAHVQAAKPVAWITSPDSTENVEAIASFAGCATNLPPDARLWLVVTGDRFYPTPITSVARGTWSVPKVGIGRETEDRGAKYEVAIWLANAAASHTLEAAQGISQMPTGVREIFKQRVRRRE